MLMKVVRAAAGILLLAALFYFRLIDFDELLKALDHPWLLILGTLACVAAIPVAGLRWHILLRSQGLVLHVWETIRIVAMGSFFATFLPGSAGGDLVRGVYIYQASHGRRTGALLSIFVDRLIGLAAFVLFGVMAALFRPTGDYGPIEYGIMAMGALFVIGLIVLFQFGHSIAQLMNRLFRGRSHRLAAIIDEAGLALHQYSKSWRSILMSFLVSLVLVALVACAVIAVAAAMQLGGLTMTEYGIAGVYAMIANSLPFTPGGLGIGEGAFQSACVALEPSTSGLPYGTVFLVLRCVIVISTLPGLIVYLVYPQRAKLLVPIAPKS